MKLVRSLATASKGGRSARGEAQRERLFEAALTVALEEGFGNVTMDRIAHRAGTSKGGLLYHFPTKRKLIEALLARFTEAAGESGVETANDRRSGIDPLTVAILLAAAEDPDLLGSFVGASFDARQTTGTMGAAEVWRLLSDSLAKRLTGCSRVV